MVEGGFVVGSLGTCLVYVALPPVEPIMSKS